MAKTPSGTIISAGYMIYAVNGGVAKVTEATQARVDSISDSQALTFAEGVMVDLKPYGICGVTVEDLAVVIQSSGAAVVAACPETGSAGCDQTKEVATC